jgi:hypothetical protein
MTEHEIRQNMQKIGEYFAKPKLTGNEINELKRIGLEIEKHLATPIDFDKLIADGVLKEAGRGWFTVANWRRLPEDLRMSIISVRVSGTLSQVKFSQVRPRKKRKK